MPRGRRINLPPRAPSLPENRRAFQYTYFKVDFTFPLKAPEITIFTFAPL